MFNRLVRVNLPSYQPTLVHQKQMDINDRLQVRRGSLIQYHGRNDGPELAPLHAGQRVRILNKDTHKWCPGEVVATCAEPRSHIVQTPNGTRLRRARSHLGGLLHATPAKSIFIEPEPLRRHVRFHEETTVNRSVVTLQYHQLMQQLGIMNIIAHDDDN